MKKTYQQMQKQVVQMLSDPAESAHRPVSIVPFKPDHMEDHALCLTSVVFPPSKLARYIHEKLILPIKQMEPHHYFYPPESLHITIKNIRTSNDPPLFNRNDINRADQLFAEIIPSHKSFKFSCEEIAVFPSSITLIGYTDDLLQKLVLSLDKGLERIGLPDNKHYISDTVFFGSMTLCRFTSEPSLKFLQDVKKIKNIIKNEFTAEIINLIICNAVCSAHSLKVVNSYRLFS